SAIPDIVDFVRRDSRTFPFVFIDPKGWTGFEMKTIQPLMALRPCEVLVNFMTSHIRRFIDSPDEDGRREFKALFDSDDYQCPPGIEPQEREDQMVRLYMRNLRRAGSFEYVCTAMVLHPQIRKTHFHLIYATRHPKGVSVFKDA